MYRMFKAMASQLRLADHLIVTSNQARQNVVTEATVTRIENISKTVKFLTLKVRDEKFHFKPGQWVDFFKPGTETVAGYSICSSTKQLESDGTIDLAVKRSDHEVTEWVHNICRVGSVLRIRSGGDFYYDASQFVAPRDVILIAGGVGINPLMSIFEHLSLEQTRNYGSVTLLYSAQTKDELVFKDRILDICSESIAVNVKAKFYATKDDPSDSTETIRCGERICINDIRNITDSFVASDKLSYVCGPPEMLFVMESFLLELGFLPNQIKYEKWW